MADSQSITIDTTLDPNAELYDLAIDINKSSGYVGAVITLTQSEIPIDWEEPLRSATNLPMYLSIFFGFASVFGYLEARKGRLDTAKELWRPFGWAILVMLIIILGYYLIIWLIEHFFVIT